MTKLSLAMVVSSGYSSNENENIGLYVEFPKRGLSCTDGHGLKRATLRFMVFLLLFIYSSGKDVAIADKKDMAGKDHVDTKDATISGKVSLSDDIEAPLALRASSSNELDALDVFTRNDNDSESTNMRKRALNILTSLRWKTRSSGRVVIPYVIIGSFNSNERNIIRNALNDLEQRSGCLEFVTRSNQRNYVRVNNDSNMGCLARLGNVMQGPQNLNLAQGCVSQGIVQHEFMHALGFHHEHTRPDRDNYVRINFNNIIPRNRDANFPIATGSDTHGSPYDYQSIMHYRRNAFAINNNIDTVTPLDSNARIGQREAATTTDIRKIKLLYQCERSIVRNWNSLIRNPCTSQCMCRRDDTGCGNNNAACHGSLICSNNRCVASTAPAPNPTPTPPSPSPSPERQWLVWSVAFGNNNFHCMDLRARSTRNYNDVWFYPCNFTPAQYWYRDSNNYIRSAVDRNKCLVGAGGRTSEGTRMIIYDCFANDTRFIWDRYSDNSIRPRNNNNVCLEPSLAQKRNGISLLILTRCRPTYREWNWYQRTSSRRMLNDQTTSNKQTSSIKALMTNNRSLLTMEDMESAEMDLRSSDDCQDGPIGWYDIFGRNCQWYNEDTNCEDYGDGYKNFGKTAMSACCACGGGSSFDIENDVSVSDIVHNTNGCWDVPDWYDATGDGCDWYSEDENCEEYGGQFINLGLSANSACCACGGGLQDPPEEKDWTKEAPPGCSDSPFNWFDAAGMDCDWYAEDNRCIKYGDDVGYHNLTAKQACCACGGGFNSKALDNNDPDGSTDRNTDDDMNESSDGNPTSGSVGNVACFSIVHCTSLVLGITVTLVLFSGW